jgi:hypothetical protein
VSVCQELCTVQTRVRVTGMGRGRVRNQMLACWHAHGEYLKGSAGSRQEVPAGGMACAAVYADRRRGAALGALKPGCPASGVYRPACTSTSRLYRAMRAFLRAPLFLWRRFRFTALSISV